MPGTIDTWDLKHYMQTVGNRLELFIVRMFFLAMWSLAVGTWIAFFRTMDDPYNYITLFVILLVVPASFLVTFFLGAVEMHRRHEDEEGQVERHVERHKVLATQSNRHLSVERGMSVEENPMVRGGTTAAHVSNGIPNTLAHAFLQSHPRAVSQSAAVKQQQQESQQQQSARSAHNTRAVHRSSATQAAL